MTPNSTRKEKQKKLLRVALIPFALLMLVLLNQLALAGAPSPEEKAFFTKLWNRYEEQNKFVSEGEGIDDMLQTINSDGTKSSRDWNFACPDGKTSAILRISTELVNWNRSDDVLGSFCWGGGVVAHEYKDATSGNKVYEVTNTVMLNTTKNPDNTEKYPDQTVFDQLVWDATFYHEMRHGQLVLEKMKDKINDTTWFQGWCSCSQWMENFYNSQYSSNLAYPLNLDHPRIEPDEDAYIWRLATAKGYNAIIIDDRVDTIMSHFRYHFKKDGAEIKYISGDESYNIDTDSVHIWTDENGQQWIVGKVIEDAPGHLRIWIDPSNTLLLVTLNTYTTTTGYNLHLLIIIAITLMLAGGYLILRQRRKLATTNIKRKIRR